MTTNGFYIAKHFLGNYTQSFFENWLIFENSKGILAVNTKTNEIIGVKKEPLEFLAENNPDVYNDLLSYKEICKRVSYNLFSRIININNEFALFILAKNPQKWKHLIEKNLNNINSSLKSFLPYIS